MSEFRIYFIRHETGNLTGYLMRRAQGLFRPKPIVAFGPDEDVVREHLYLEMARRRDELSITDYLWTEKFKTKKVKIEVRPATSIGSTWVVGNEIVPLRLSYAYSELPKGGFRLMLPRFDWSLIVETLDDATPVLRQTIASALMGSDSKWAFDFREQDKEWVESWKTDFDTSEKSWDFQAESNQFAQLSMVGEELVAKAKSLPTAVGENRVDTLIRFSKNKPPTSFVMVGEPGTGKTTRLHQLAKRLAVLGKQSSVPKIWATDSERIVAGMMYLGEWEKRCLDIVAELRHEGDWLYVGRLEDFVAERSGGSSIADLFFPAIREGTISIIAETTPESWTRCQRNSPSLCALLSVGLIEPTPPSNVPQLVKEYLERKGAPFVLHPDATRRIVRFLETFQPASAFPGKAFQFMDWFIEERRHSRKPDASSVIRPTEITQAFSKRTGLPAELLSDDIAAGRKEVAAKLQKRVVGQDLACLEAARVIARLKSGMNDPEKPCGSLFFVGPTGVGKTELAKEMARFMFGDTEKMIRFDMSEFQTAHSAARLIATGRNRESLVTRVRNAPLTLLLFDEIEKAHPAVFDLLLGVLGEGRLSDDRGRLVDFRMAVIVMTSNLGVSNNASVGFSETASGKLEKNTLRQHFRPEFFNRLDAVVPFESLSPESVETICKLMLNAVNLRVGLAERNVKVVVSEDGIERLSSLGFNPKHGARPLARVIEERIVTPLAVVLAKDPELKDITAAFGEDLKISLR